MMPSSQRPPSSGREVIERFDESLALLAFLDALAHTQILMPDGTIATIQWQPGSDNAVIDLRGITASGAAPATELPSQTGNAGKVLTTDGTTPSWSSL